MDMIAEISRLTAEVARLKGIVDMDDDAYSEGFDAGFGEAKLTQDITEKMLREKVARLTAERDAAIKALCEAATARGQAEGKLAASEMAGVVEGWKTRAKKAEAEIAAMLRASPLPNVMVTCPVCDGEGYTDAVIDDRCGKCNGTGSIPSAEKAEAERDNLIRANHRQAICIHTCGAHIGPDTDCTIEGLPKAVKHVVAERDQALAQAAAAAMEMRERCVRVLDNYTGTGFLADQILALPIDPDAQKALDKMLAQARDVAIREAASVSGHYMSTDEDELLLDMWREDILDLLNDGGRDE